MRGGRWAGEQGGARAREVEGGPQEEQPWRGDGRGCGETWYLLRQPGGDVSWVPSAGLPWREGLTKSARVGEDRAEPTDRTWRCGDGGWRKERPGMCWRLAVPPGRESPR